MCDLLGEGPGHDVVHQRLTVAPVAILLSDEHVPDIPPVARRASGRRHALKALDVRHSDRRPPTSARKKVRVARSCSHHEMKAALKSGSSIGPPKFSWFQARRRVTSSVTSPSPAIRTDKATRRPHFGCKVEDRGILRASLNAGCTTPVGSSSRRSGLRSVRPSGGVVGKVRAAEAPAVDGLRDVERPGSGAVGEGVAKAGSLQAPVGCRVERMRLAAEP